MSKSSPSRKLRYSPRLAAMPALRAALSPPLAWVTSRTRWPSTNAATRDAVPSVEPSSTTMSSKSRAVCLSTDRIAGTTTSATS